MLTAGGKKPVVLPAIGDPFMGGYYAGIIDTTRGNIITNDASQVGLRYALIVAAKSLEGASLQYKTSNTGAPAATQTRWDGLTATATIASTTYPAADYCHSLAYPTDGGSRWYLPAMDEAELIYRNLKPTTSSNTTSLQSGGNFPGGADFPNGYNPSSDPTGAGYTSSSPSQTAVAAFRYGGGQDLRVGSWDIYWTATESTASAARAFRPGSGWQDSRSKSDSQFVRPVRRLVL